MSSETSEVPDQKAPKPAREEPPHYHGHRQRLRERFRSAGAAALSDYELLEMVLFAAQPRRDMKPLAKALLKRFGSFAEVIHAPETLLREVDGVGEACVDQLELSATAIILVHNHPSGDPTPSQADVRMTKAIVDIAVPLGIAVHDHIIVGRNGHASLKGMKLI